MSALEEGESIVEVERNKMEDVAHGCCGGRS